MSVLDGRKRNKGREPIDPKGTMHESIHFQIHEEDKHKIDAASAYLGMSISEFVRLYSTEKATDVLSDMEVTE